MESDFYDLYENQQNLSVSVAHSSICDWCLVVTDKSGVDSGDGEKTIVDISGCDRKLVFSQGYAELAKYLSENRGGY